MRVKIFGKEVLSIGKSFDTLLDPRFDDWFARQGGTPNTKSKSASLGSDKGHVFDCVNLISNRVSTAEAVFYIEQAGEEVELTEDQFKFIKVWDAPNPWFSGRMLRELIQAHLSLCGEGYMFKAMDGLGMINELWPLNPSEMTIVHKHGEYRFEHHTGGETTQYHPDEIIYLRYAAPGNPLTGRSPLQAKALQYDIAHSIDKYHWTLFENSGYFHYALSTDQAMSAEQTEQIRNGWANSVRTLQSKFKPPVLTKGLQLTQLQGNALDLGVTATSESMRDQILAAYGVPKALLGMMEGIMRANLDGAEYGFAKNTIQPALDTWSDGMVPHLRMLDDRVRMRFDNVVPKDEAALLTETETLSRIGALTVEEIRQRHGLDPEFTDGETLISHLASTTTIVGEEPEPKVSAGNPFAPAEDDDGAAKGLTGGNTDNGSHADAGSIPAGSTTTPATPARLSKAWWTDERIEAHQRKFEVDTEIRERRWMPAIARWIKEWEAYALAYSAAQIRYAENRYAGWSQDKIKADYIPKTPQSNEIEKIIFERASVLHRLDYEEAGQEAIDFVGTKVDFNMNNATTVQWLEARSVEFAVAQGARLADDLVNILRKGVADGLTTLEIAGIIKQQMEWEGEGYRAERIARTEVIAATNAARNAGHLQAGVRMQSWSSALDERTRDTHREADHRYRADPIPMGGEFMLSNGAHGPWPGAMSVKGENINCRCTTKAEKEEREE